MRLLAGVALVLALAACTGGEASATPVATTSVDLPPSYRFEPADIVVPMGATVTWTNHDNFTHSVRLLDDGGEVMQLAPGESVEFTFTTPGLHHYDCSFHPTDMKGTVLVLDEGPGSSGAPPPVESDAPDASSDGGNYY